MDLAAEQICELPADGEAEAGAAVFPAGACIRLLECLKDQLLFFRGNTYARVGNLKGDDRRSMIQDRMLAAPAPDSRRNAQPPAAFGGKPVRRRKTGLQ